jgi:hypothetical protein
MCAKGYVYSYGSEKRHRINCCVSGSFKKKLQQEITTADAKSYLKMIDQTSAMSHIKNDLYSHKTQCTPLSDKYYDGIRYSPLNDKLAK